MAGNITPIFSKVGDIQWVNGIATANTTTDLTAGTSYLAFTSDATNGGYVQKVRFRANGTNLATVARIWLNNGSVTTDAANNTLFDELSLAATSVSQVSALSISEIPLNIALPPGYRIYITIGTAVAAGYAATVIGGKY